jgi:ribosomal protein S18 acetylase RimI-like enzyme
VNGRPVGRLGIDYRRKADQGIVHLWAFGVLPQLQRLGIGTALIREAEKLIASAPRAATTLEIGVDEGNDEAAKLYRRLGYRDAGIERGRSGETIRLLRRPIFTTTLSRT